MYRSGCILLLGTVFVGGSLVGALLAGLMLFWGYGLYRGSGLAALLHMTVSGVMQAKNVLAAFILIGILTAFWRAGGTIPAIVHYASTLISPSVVILLAFLLNAFVSFLLGSSLATAATMGVISMTMAVSLGASPALAGGAMLSGVYFGDRASPVSTSALLVSELTKTDIYGNIRNMFRSAFVPTVISALLYFFIGGDNGNQEIAEGIDFSSYFYIGVPVLLPALAILLLGFFRVDVKKTMAFSIFLAAGCTFIFQHISITDLFQMAVWGFYPENEDLAKAVGRGGLVSMVQVSVIICISSSYAGIFHGTGMLDGIQQKIEHLSGKISSFCAILVVSVVTSMIACNQTLPSVLTHELCGHLVENRERLALALEDSVVVVSALVPWSIACAVPLDSVGAPVSSVPLAFYL